MWAVSDAAQGWHDAMQAQTEHEGICLPCRVVGASRTPVCAEGKRLQRVAVYRQNAWAADEYAGKAVA